MDSPWRCLLKTDTFKHLALKTDSWPEKAALVTAGHRFPCKLQLHHICWPRFPPLPQELYHSVSNQQTSKPATWATELPPSPQHQAWLRLWPQSAVSLATFRRPSVAQCSHTLKMLVRKHRVNSMPAWHFFFLLPPQLRVLLRTSSTSCALQSIPGCPGKTGRSFWVALCLGDVIRPVPPLSLTPHPNQRWLTSDRVADYISSSHESAVI